MVNALSCLRHEIHHISAAVGCAIATFGYSSSYLPYLTQSFNSTRAMRWDSPRVFATSEEVICSILVNSASTALARGSSRRRASGSRVIPSSALRRVSFLAAVNTSASSLTKYSIQDVRSAAIYSGSMGHGKKDKSQRTGGSQRVVVFLCVPLRTLRFSGLSRK